ncbi:hypothetical protein QZH41_015110, partial [Actinostola sp. cb2023]
MITPLTYPIPVLNYHLDNNIWGTASEGNLRRKGSHLTTPIVRSTRTLRPLPVTEAWGQRRRLRALFYHPSDHTLPKEPQKTDPLGQYKHESSYKRAYHLQNFHDKGYETSIVPTNNDPYGIEEGHRKRQHFIRGVVPGGSQNNKMIYGTDELLRQTEEKRTLTQATGKKEGFLYGTPAATNVGKQKPSTRPNNALWLEQRVFDDHTSQNKKLAFDQDDFLESHRREKHRQMMELQIEKKRDLEMLRSFEPWGRPGAGAPNKGSGPITWEARRTKAVTTLKEEEYNPIGGGRGGGGGAPNRTVSGKPLALLHADPELRFPTYGQSGDVVPPSLRYKKDKDYGRDLETFMDNVKARKELQRQESLEQELRHISHDPYGRPGAGAPMTNEKGQVKSYYPTTLSKDMCELRTVEPRHPHAYNDTQSKSLTSVYQMWPKERYDPWGKGYGTVERDRAGNIVKTIKPKTDDLDGIGIPVGRPGAGAPMKDDDGNIKTKKTQTLTKNNYGQLMSRDFSPKGSRDVYNPFGKPGAGAPLIDPHGKVKTHLIAKVEHDGMQTPPITSKNDLYAKQTYLKTLQDMKDQALQQRRIESEDLRKSGTDVASWLRSGVVGQPKFDPVTKEIVATHKHTSDITQQKLNIRRQKTESSSTYHHDLQVLAEERQQLRKKERDIERETSLQHVNTMNQLWGRPGAGAPLSEGDVINARKQR